MNKKYLIGLILLALIIVIAGAFVILNKYFVVENWKIISRSSYNSIILNDSLAESVRRGDIDTQIKIAEEILSSNSDANDAKLNLADSYLEKASIEFKEEEYANKAVVLAEEVIKNDDKNYKAYLTLGYAYEVLQNYPKSLEEYNKSLEINNNYDIAYVKRGHLYDLWGNLTQAESDYTKAYELNNKNDVALMNLARIAQRKGDFEKAVNYANTVIEISKISYVKATAYEIIGLNSLNSFKFQEAVDSFSKSIGAYDKYSTSYINRAYANIRLVNYDLTNNQELKNTIEKDLTRSLQINDKSSFAHVIYGIYKESLKDYDLAYSYYEKALALVDGDITLGMGEKEDMKNKITRLINTFE